MALMPWGRRINVIERFSSVTWPTPATINTTSNKGKFGRTTAGKSRGGARWGLEELAKGEEDEKNWPSPTAHDDLHGGYPADLTRKSPNLPSTVRLEEDALPGPSPESPDPERQWATPATDPFRSRGGSRINEIGLDRQVKEGTEAQQWSTPRAYSQIDSNEPGLSALDIQARGMYLDKERYHGKQTESAEDAEARHSAHELNERYDELTPEEIERHSRVVNDYWAKQPAPPPADKPWATPTVREGMGGPGHQGREGGENLRTQLGSSLLNPFWESQLLGFPEGWLSGDAVVPAADRLAVCVDPHWPAGRGAKQKDFEHSRLVERGMPGRRDMVKAMGNSCCPAQAYVWFKAIVDADEGRL